MNWNVTISRRTTKVIKKLPKRVQNAIKLLIGEIRLEGPVRGNWPNYSKLSRYLHHCHLKKGQPTYVAIWEERDGDLKLVEVTYVGTHEKAPY